MKPRILENQPPARRNVETVETAREVKDIWLESLFGGVLALFVGYFVLWSYLTVDGFFRLSEANTPLLQSPGITIGLASWVAFIFCGVGFPLMLPWFLAFLASELYLPRNSLFWKWWVRTPLGMGVGVLALWLDALVYSLIDSGTLIVINVPLLRSASLPAAIMGGAACFSAAAGQRISKTVLRATFDGVH